MRQRWLAVGLVWMLLLGAGLLHATTITYEGSGYQSTFNFQNIVVYFTAKSQNNKKITPGHSGFFQTGTPSNANSLGLDVDAGSAVIFPGYTGSETLTHAVLDQQTATQNIVNPSWSLYATNNGPTNYLSQKTLTLQTTGFFLVTVGSVTLVLDAATFTSIDLMTDSASVAAGIPTLLLNHEGVTLGWREHFEYGLSPGGLEAPDPMSCGGCSDTWSSTTGASGAFGARLTYTTDDQPSEIPEPTAALLLGAGLLALGALRRFI